LKVSNLPVRAASISNPGATRFGDEIVLLVRVENTAGFSEIYVARSRNGVTPFYDEPVRWPVDVVSDAVNGYRVLVVVRLRPFGVVKSAVGELSVGMDKRRGK